MAKTIDPTRSITLRMQFYREFHRHLRNLSKAVYKWVGTEDQLGLGEKKYLFNALEYGPDVELSEENELKLIKEAVKNVDSYTTLSGITIVNSPSQQYAFLTDPQKQTVFRDWLTNQVDTDMLKPVGGLSGKPWTAPYIESAYSKGLLRAYTDTNSAAMAENLDFYEGTKSQFLRSAFGQAVATGKIETLATRTFENMKGLTDTAKLQMNRILAEGMLKGNGPISVARDMRRSIAGLSKTRAKMIARTEIVHAHAEGQLNAFEEMGVKDLGLMAEWSSAGDDLVCIACQDMANGSPYKVKSSHGLIPLHPNCRCAWIPYLKGHSKAAKNPLTPSLYETKKTLERYKPRNPLGVAKPKPRRFPKVAKVKVPKKVSVAPVVPKTVVVPKPKVVWPSVIKKTRVSKSVGGSVPIKKVGKVSKEFEKSVISFEKQLPAGVRQKLNKDRVVIKIGHNATEIDTRLKGVTPRGWGRGMTWDNCGAWQSSKRKEVGFAEYKKAPSYGRGWVSVKSIKPPQETFFHEIGHAFQDTISKTDGKSFTAAYRKDMAVLRSGNKLRNYPYFTQPGDAGVQETFAQLFSNDLYDSSRFDLRKVFPNAKAEMVRIIDEAAK